MKGIIFLSIALLAGLFQSCSQEEEIGCMDTDRICISATITPLAESRASLSADGSGQFSDGDSIRLFISEEGSGAPEAAYTLTRCANEWLPGLSWKDIRAEQLIFSATHPALPEGQTSFTLAIDQREKSTYEQSDLLLAQARVQRKQPVALSFKHALSRVCITLSSDGSFTPEELAEASISIRSKNRIKIDTAQGTTGEACGEEVSIMAYHEVDNVFQAIVCPQAVEDDWRVNGWMEIRIGENVLAYPAPQTLNDGSSFHRLEAGKQISLNIRLKKEEEGEESWANRTAWIYGIQNPPVDTWGYAFLTEKIPGLKWQPEYGWYDCNKLDSSLSGIDSNLCWAATVSNMIHWWLDQNKAYIERYGKYTGPRAYKSSIDSEVFDHFKKNFPNTGHDVAAALNWFFTGRYLTSTKPNGAFFKEVLGTDPIVRITRFGERTLTEEIQKAIHDREVIGLTIQYPSYLHAVSLWGADFDSNGEVCAIYISDSNDRWLDEQQELFPPQVFHHQTPAGIIRKRVQQQTDGVYMESSAPGKYTFKIEELNLINRMTDKWDAYFQAH